MKKIVLVVSVLIILACNALPVTISPISTLTLEPSLTTKPSQSSTAQPVAVETGTPTSAPTRTTQPSSTSTPVPLPAFTETFTPQGSIYYVALTGNDDNPGSETKPWRTIQKAAEILKPGETVYIRTGVYRERVIPRNSGSSQEQTITYSAFPGESVTIDGSDTAVPEDEGLFYVMGLNYIRITNLRIINSAYAGILIDQSGYIAVEKNVTSNTASSGIGVWGSHHIAILSNEVELACSNGMQESLTVAGTNTFEVKNNTVHNGTAGYDKEGICIKDGSSGGKVYRNLVYHTTAVGLYVDAWNKHTFDIAVYQNVIHDTGSSGIALASETGGQLENIRVTNNIAYHNKTVGIWVSGCCKGVKTHPLKDIVIINNTLYQNGREGWGGGIAVDNNPNVQNIVIRNNLCSDNLSFQIAVDDAVPAQAVSVDHNLVDGYRGGKEGEIYGSDSVKGDALMVDAAGGDFHLQAASPAIDSGIDTDAPTDDFDNNLRPQDGNSDGSIAFDIGAYEYTQTP